MGNRMRKMAVIAGTLGVAAALAGCALLPKEKEDRDVVLVERYDGNNYTREMVIRQDLIHSEIVNAVYGQTEVQDLSFPDMGALSRINVSEGDRVTEGEIVAVMEGYAQAQQEVQSCEESLQSQKDAFDELTMERDYQLREQEIYYRYGQISEAEYQQRLSDISDTYDGRIAELEDGIYIEELRLERANQTLERNVLRSQSEGVVTYVHPIRSEDQQENWGGSGRTWVQAGERIVSIAALDTGSFVAQTEYADRFQVGDAVTLSSGQGRFYSTVVTSVSEDTVQFDLEMPNASLTTGTVANYTLILEEKKDVLTISRNALQGAEDFYYVYYLNENNIREMKQVQVGMFGNSRVEITEGLKEADWVITR